MIDTVVLTNEDLKILTEGNSETIQKTWARFPMLQQEFGTFATFEAYVQALQAGHTSTIHGGGLRTMKQPRTPVSALGS